MIAPPSYSISKNRNRLNVFFRQNWAEMYLLYRIFFPYNTALSNELLASDTSLEIHEDIRGGSTNNKYEGTILFQCSHRYSSSICAFKYHNHSKKLQSKYLQLMTFTIHITAMKTGRNKGSLSMDGYVLNVVCGNVVCRS